MSWKEVGEEETISWSSNCERCLIHAKSNVTTAGQFKEIQYIKMDYPHSTTTYSTRNSINSNDQLPLQLNDFPYLSFDEDEIRPSVTY